MMRIKRRNLLAGLILGSASLPTGLLAQARPNALNVTDLGIVPDLGVDQSDQFAEAMATASRSGTPLFIPAGQYLVSGVELPANSVIRGVGRATILGSPNGNTIFQSSGKNNITLAGLAFDGQNLGEGEVGALVDFKSCGGLNLTDCSFRNTKNNGIHLKTCSGRVEASTVTNCGETGMHLQNSVGMLISGNRIADCGNGGIRVWRSESGRDGTIVTNNQINGIGSDDGNGQNGNGVNIFRADQVIVANNLIENCAFSAVRANTTNNTIISGNQCINSSEVAVFSEFAFSGSIISDNIIDGAARGISITNFNDGGHLAVCANNIVRNIMAFSPTNPNTRPIGIFAEADTAITGNVVENVPGIGISAGWGPFLRNVLVSNNIVRKTLVGIAVSVAEGSGYAKISGNLIADAERIALAGLAWTDVISTDLVRDADRFPHISLNNNSIV